MIDTIKIYTMINNEVYNKIIHSSIVNSKINKRTGELLYQINSSCLIGSFSSSVNIRVGDGQVYGFKDYKYLSIEGSYHKLICGYNSHNGFYDFLNICKWFISAVEYDFNIKLPNFKHWFLNRIDISIVYDLGDNINVCNYINNLRFCRYPRRNIKHYQDESIYCSGTTTTLKIYNKMLEFKKHDMKKLFKYNFDINNYLNEIKGFVRFECEVKKKKLQDIYDKKYIRIKNVRYDFIKNVWRDEFMKMLNFFESDLKIVKNKVDIENRLLFLYGNIKGRNLYNFYCSLMLDGVDNVKSNTSKSTFCRKINDLKSAGIDCSQKFEINLKQDNIIDFNPFEWKEVI